MNTKNGFMMLLMSILVLILVVGCQPSRTDPSGIEGGRTGLENTGTTENSVPKSGYLEQNLELGMIKSKFTCGPCHPGENCLEGQCKPVALENQNFCGNYQCENGESASGKAYDYNNPIKSECYLDCNPPCLAGALCNQYAEVHCACDEYPVLSKRHGCIGNAPACNNCGVQADLMPEVLKIQTEIVKCLNDYFEYQPNRIVYKVFNNPTLDKCTQEGGCSGAEGGIGGGDYIIFHNLNGFRAYGEVVPTKPEYLTADVHETTHHYLYQMLHGLPSWFHEAIAIQTNERLNCSARQSPEGDAYLQERENQVAGIFMDDGTYLNLDFYKRLRDGKTQLSETEKTSPHLLGTLFAIGLKEDYDCGFECFKDVVIKLREKEQGFCRLGKGEKCAIYNYEKGFVLFGLGAGMSDDWETVTPKIIKEVFDEVTGKNIQPLYNLLGLSGNPSTPGNCGPVACTN